MSIESQLGQDKKSKSKKNNPIQKGEFNPTQTEDQTSSGYLQDGIYLFNTRGGTKKKKSSSPSRNEPQDNNNNNNEHG